MIRFVAVLVLGLAVVGCNGKKGSDRSSQASSDSTGKRLPYESKIEYRQGAMPNGETAAIVDGQPISWNQLGSNARSLAEQEMKWRKKTIAFVNEVVQQLVAQKKLPANNLTIEFYFVEPKEPQKMGVINSEDIRSVFKGLIEIGTLAKVGDQKIYAKDLLGSSLESVRLYRNLYTQRMRRLNGIVVRRYLLKASKAEGIGMAEYVREKILSQEVEVTSDMVRQFAKEKNIAEADLNEKLLSRLKDIVAQRNRDKKIEDYVVKNLIKEPVLVGFQPPEYNMKTPKLSDAVPHWGEDGGKSLLFIGHWSCQQCADALRFFVDGKEKWSKHVRGSFLYFFPDSDRESRMSAEASLCVYNQKPEYYWSFVKTLMQAENANGEMAINQAVRDSGADFDSFRQCFLSRKYQQTVDTHLAMVKQMGVYRSPIMVVEGRVYEAPVDVAAMTKAIHTAAGKGGSTGGLRGLLTWIKNFFSRLF